MSWYSNEKPDDFTKVNKGLNEPANKIAYNFYGFYLKNYRFESCVFQEQEKPYSQTNYENNLVKLCIINKIIIFSLYLTPPGI